MKSMVWLLATTGAIAYAAPALAENVIDDAQSEESDGQSHGIGEIVVTAERFETNIQTTPVSVEVYSNEMLREKNVFTIADLPRVDASVNFIRNAGHEGLAVRGISTSNGTETGEPAVSVSVDGTYNNRGYSLRSALYDIERLEVLRGPQGTLFGRNTTGGLLKVITRRPEADFSASISADFGNYRRKNFEGYLNLPITDTLSGRVSFMSRDRDGFTVNDFDQRANDDQISSIRGQLQWQPNAALTLWVSASYTDDGGLGDVGEGVPFRYADPALPFEPLHTVPPLSDGVNYPINGKAGQKVETKDFKFSATYELPEGITFSYLVGYNKINLFRPAPFLFRGAPSSFTRREHPRTWNHEFRVSSAPDGPFIWQIGAQLLDEKSSLDTNLVREPASSAETELYRFLTPFVHQNSKAVFGQASYELVDGLKFTAGARYTEDEKSRRGNFFIRSAFTGAPVDIVSTQDGDSKSDKVTWLAGIDYQVTPNSFLYAKASTGYKAGGFTGAAEYAPETVRAYEIGTKNRFFDDKLQVNISAYYMDYLNQQVNQYQSVNGSPPQAITTNAGKSRIYGIESSVIGKVGGLGTLSGSVNYTNARYKSFLVGAPWSDPRNPLVGVVELDLTGNHLPAAPTWTVTADWEKVFYDVYDGDVTFNVNGKYQSTTYFAPTNYANQTQRGYVLFNGSVGYERSDGSWGVDFYVDNIGDKKYFGYADEIYPFASYVFSYGAPRQYGIRVKANF